MAAVCLDASLVLTWLLPEEFSAKAFALRELWDEQATQLIAPPLLRIEVASGLRQAVHRGRLDIAEGDEAFQTFLEMKIHIREPEPLLTQAWNLGKSVSAPRLYDMFYVALAELQQCELWTADRRLVNLVKGRWPLARWLGDFSMQAETTRTSKQQAEGHAE
jgi:predicted nucleic acid-binding protein